MGRDCPTTIYGKHRPGSKDLKDHQKLAKQSRELLAVLDRSKGMSPAPKTPDVEQPGREFAEETNLMVSRSASGDVAIANEYGTATLSPEEADLLGINPDRSAYEAASAIDEAASYLSNMEISDDVFSEIEYIVSSGMSWDDAVRFESEIARETAGRGLIPVSRISEIKERVDAASGDNPYGSDEERRAFREIADDLIDSGSITYEGFNLGTARYYEDMQSGKMTFSVAGGGTKTVPWAGELGPDETEPDYREEVAGMVGAVYYANQDEPYDARRRMELIEGVDGESHETYRYLSAAKKVSDIARPLIDNYHEFD